VQSSRPQSTKVGALSSRLQSTKARLRLYGDPLTGSITRSPNMMDVDTSGVVPFNEVVTDLRQNTGPPGGTFEIKHGHVTQRTWYDTGCGKEDLVQGSGQSSKPRKAIVQSRRFRNHRLTSQGKPPQSPACVRATQRARGTTPIHQSAHQPLTACCRDQRKHDRSRLRPNVP